MSSEANLVESESETQIRRLNLLLPLIFRAASHQQNLEHSTRNRRIRIILFNPATRTTIMIDRSGEVDSLFRRVSRKPELLPASRDSVEAMPMVVVTEEDSDCAICLDDFRVGEEAREMPCKHRFHSDCIEKWLGIHGLCPICRFVMPAADAGDGSGTSGSGFVDLGRGSEYPDESINGIGIVVSAIDDDMSAIDESTDMDMGF